MGPPCAEALAGAIPGAELAIFEDSAHLPHIEEAAAYRARLDTFLRRIDGLSAG
jgi:pimeloyl-ACP methyl ester carboxylesterase